jgi:deoxyribonuclease-4
MLRIGAHMSIAGGVSRAVDRAEVHGCEALQIFTKNANRWVSKPLDPLEVRRFRRRIDETGIVPAVSHASYLINLASAFEPLRAQSIDAFVDELDRAHALGLLGVVIHPGTCTSGSEQDALRLVASAVRTAFKRRRPSFRASRSNARASRRLATHRRVS